MAAEGGTYTISQAAERLGVTAYTLRYYDKEGLLPFVARSQGGARVFTDRDLENLRIISCLKASGMPIKDIREFLHWCALGDESLSQRSMFLERCCQRPRWSSCAAPWRSSNTSAGTIRPPWRRGQRLCTRKRMSRQPLRNRRKRPYRGAIPKYPSRPL